MTSNSFVKGIFSSVIMRWSVKFIGIFNTMILARILMPEDFGLVAMAAIFRALVEEFSTINVSLLLIRKKGDAKEAANTAWTVSIIQSFFLALMLCLLAPLAVDFFAEERVRDIIYFMAAIKILAGFNNIGVVLARKDLDFMLDYKFMVYSRIATFCSVMLLVYFIRDYRAIIYGDLLGAALTVAISYILHPYRPQFSKKNISEYLKFSLNMIPYSICRLLNNKLSVLLVGKVASASVMGGYNVCNELASMFTKELMFPVLRGMYPNLTKIADDRKAFNRIFINTYSFTAAICFPIVIVLWFYSKDVVLILLGQQWVETHEFLKYLSIYGGLTSMMMVISEQSLIAIGMESKANKLMWFRLIMLLPAVLLGYHLSGFIGMIQAMIVVTLFSMNIILLHIAKLFKINRFLFIKKFLRLALPGSAMAACIYWLTQYNFTDSFAINYYIEQAIIVSLAVLAYVATIFILWLLAGRQEGFESTIFKRF
ncbi:MAG: oligosaccharide flippase family protein [Methyloprofundus sp.]|nr:oligosaccharide flippase family protein [Methyloprofundus sp.]